VKISRVLNWRSYTLHRRLESLQPVMLNGRVNHQQCLIPECDRCLITAQLPLICVLTCWTRWTRMHALQPRPRIFVLHSPKTFSLQRRDSDEPFSNPLNCTPTRGAMGARGCIVLRWQSYFATKAELDEREQLQLLELIQCSQVVPGKRDRTGL